MKIQVIIGSTRPGRVGPQIANWIIENATKENDAEYEIIDVSEANLPIFDEPIHPSMGQYQHDHTKAWSEKIKPADGYIFVTPEYNAGYPASLKNAIDYLYAEWTSKPVTIVSYGVGGGTTASAQLRQVAERLKMRPTDISPALTIKQEMSGEDGQIKDPNEAFAPDVPMLKDATKQLIELVLSPVS